MTPDERVALNNQVFRDYVVPALPPGEGAVLIMFATDGKGTLTYISNGHREDMRNVLGSLLSQWEGQAMATDATRPPPLPVKEFLEQALVLIMMATAGRTREDRWLAASSLWIGIYERHFK